MVDIKTLIKKEIVKIIEDGSYICASGWTDANRDCTTEKFQAMTNSFDTHLTILLRNYKDETVVSVYPWPKDNIDKIPIPYDFNKTQLKYLLDKMKVYIVPADLDLPNWISHSRNSNGRFFIDGEPQETVPTAFFKIKYNEGNSFRNCFESIRSVLIGNCLSKAA